MRPPCYEHGRTGRTWNMSAPGLLPGALIASGVVTDAGRVVRRNVAAPTGKEGATPSAVAASVTSHECQRVERGWGRGRQGSRRCALRESNSLAVPRRIAGRTPFAVGSPAARRCRRTLGARLAPLTTSRRRCGICRSSSPESIEFPVPPWDGRGQFRLAAPASSWSYCF